MTTYTIDLTDVEQKAMEYIAVDVNEWIQNAVHERARIAIDELVRDDINATLAAGGTVSGTKEEIVMGSELPSAADRNDEMNTTPLTKETAMYGDPEVDPPKTPVPPTHEPPQPEPEPDEDDEDEAAEEEADEPKT